MAAWALGQFIQSRQACMTLVSFAAADGLKYAAGMKDEWNGFGGEPLDDFFHHQQFSSLTAFSNASVSCSITTLYLTASQHRYYVCEN